MKKVFLFLFGLFFAVNAWAGIITFDPATTNTDITKDWLNNSLGTVYNVVNGGLDTNNFSTGAVTSKDIATNTNPLVRENELVGEYVYSGLTIATSTDLSSTITAGIAYVENDSDDTLHRVVTADTAKTFTASKDTWVYLSYNGSFYYDEQALGAAQPTTPDNYMLIAKVVTDATKVASVTDYRQVTPVNMRVYLDYKSGCIVSRDVSTATTVTIARGDIELGTTGKARRNTSSKDIDFTIIGRGGLDTGALQAEQYYFIYAIPDDDNNLNFEGIASLSSSDASGVTNERLIGWCYAPTASIISPDSIGAYRGLGGDAPNLVTRYNNTGDSISNAAYATMAGMEARFYSSGRPVKITFNGVMTEAGDSCNLRMLIDSVAVNNMGSLNISDTLPLTMEWTGTLSAGPHTIEVQGQGGSANLIVGEKRLIIQEL